MNKSNLKEGKSASSNRSETAPNKSCIKEVWSHNLYDEFRKMRKLAKTYSFIAMDTEFPGEVYKKDRGSRPEVVYDVLRKNVGVMRLIQVGMTLFNEKGERAPDVCTWQFNFKFDVDIEEQSKESIDFLVSCGVHFAHQQMYGIKYEDFAYHLLSSNMILSEDITWIVFHGGYDFGYLIKTCRNNTLPDNLEEFQEMLKIYFPVNFDIKYLITSIQLSGGLQDLANELGIARVGAAHQAGSDSLLTGMVFFKMQEMWFGGKVNPFYEQRLFELCSQL